MNRPASRAPWRACAAATLAAALVVAACGGGSPGADSTSRGSGTGAGPTAQSGWTTLGTRTLPSGPEQTIGSNAGAGWKDYDPPPVYPRSVVDANQYITMDDGVRLGATVAWPADAAGNKPAQPLPVILTLTGYSKDNGAFVPIIGGSNPYFLAHGYIHVNVDVRGTGRSDGQWMALDRREQKDYGEVVDWVLKQPWSNGSIGMYGTSLLGITSVFTACQGNPAIKAVYVIGAPISDAYRDFPLVGGQGNYAFLSIWMSFVAAMGMINASAFQDPQQFLSATLQHLQGYLLGFSLPTILQSLLGSPQTIYDTDFWAQRSSIEQIQTLKAPVFIASGLFDVAQRGAPRTYDALKNHTTAKLLMGPWNHIQVSGNPQPGGGVPVLDHSALMWFDHYLKGEDTGAEKVPNVTLWAWGAEKWTTNTDWPNPQASAQRLYLHGDKSLSAQAPGAGEAGNLTPQLPLSGGICSENASQVSLGILGLTQLPCYENDNLANAAEIVYETAPMKEDFYFAGPLEADLWITSTGTDAGVIVRVSDVGPDGNARNLSTGLQTASLRAVDPAKSRYLDGQMIQPWHPFTQDSVQPLSGGRPVLVPVEVFPTNAVIKAGHKLRIAVGGDTFPQGLPDVAQLPGTALAVMTVYSDAAHPSGVVLPVVPASVLQ